MSSDCTPCTHCYPLSSELVLLTVAPTPAPTIPSPLVVQLIQDSDEWWERLLYGPSLGGLLALIAAVIGARVLWKAQDRNRETDQGIADAERWHNNYRWLVEQAGRPDSPLSGDMFKAEVALLRAEAQDEYETDLLNTLLRKNVTTVEEDRASG